MTNFISYNQWLNEMITPTINKHMSHAEDLVFLGGKEGLQWVIGMFKQLYTKLKSDTEKDQIKLSVKFDGAPSVFGWSSFLGLEKPGIAIKGLFAKDRKIIFNNEDIDKFYSKQPDLVNKLRFMLKYISFIEIPAGEIWQGDFLFDKTTLKLEKDYYVFHPNTIVYKIKKDSDIGKKIGNADIGVVWHTRYTGTSLDDISAKYNTKVHELNNHSKIFMTDPYIASLAGIVTLTEEEKDAFNKSILKIEDEAKNLYDAKGYKEIIDDAIFISLFKIFQNLLIKRNIRVKDSEYFLNEFVKFVNERYDKEFEEKKTEKAKNSIITKKQQILDKIEQNEELKIIVSLILEITELKDIFIKKLNNIGKFETYLETRSGKYLSTGQEGFAVSDIHGNVIKLVDRYDFSFANFSPNIVKGWTK